MEGYLKDSSSFSKNLINAASKVANFIARKHGIPKDDLHIIGHNFGDTDKIKQTPLEDCNDHGDPGKFFPWARFLKLVSGGRDSIDEYDAPEPPAPGGTPPKRCWFWCS